MSKEQLQEMLNKFNFQYNLAKKVKRTGVIKKIISRNNHKATTLIKDYSEFSNNNKEQAFGYLLGRMQQCVDVIKVGNYEQIILAQYLLTIAYETFEIALSMYEEEPNVD